ncbi:hypothetical protein E2C01_019435 [Portunus trituberculatus]|uniref:Uncharacterized protein n=1 Tax=Portunus trituberculatus TaxID=210409 RepID=A0A5B7DYV8_PORTR|nr:hypothetical protein [Portunus trituberculatus]
MMYKLVNCMERIDRQDLVSLSKIMKSQCLRNIKKFSFHIGQWTSGIN